MKRLVLTGCVLAGLFSGSTAFAQDAKDGQLTLSGQVRPRFEFRNGFKKPVEEGQEPAAFMEQRTRLTAGYKASKFNLKLSVQDVRVWGEVGQINKTDGLTSFHEAYGEWTPDSLVTVRIGRQEFVYDDARILGKLGWAAQGRSHDAVKIVYKVPTWELHVAATYNQDSDQHEPGWLQSASAGDFNSVSPTTAAANDVGFALAYPLSTQFVWFKTKLGSAGGASFIALNDLTQVGGVDDADVTSLVSRVTVGTNPAFKFGDFKVDGTFYYQIGKTDGTTRTNGYLGNLDVTYTGAGKVIPTLGFDILSGDDKTTADVTEGFNPLYGTHHKFYGFMDYFYVGNGHNGGGNQLSGGLVDIYAKSVFKLGKPGKLVAHLHGFLSPTEVDDDLAIAAATLDGETSDANEGSFLGTELDLVYVKKLSGKVMFKLGTSFMFQTDAMNAIKNVSTNGTATDYNAIGLNNWSWAMIDFKF